MTLHLELPTEIEQALRAHAEAVGQPIDTVVAECVAQRLAEPEPAAKPSPRLSKAEFAARLHRLATQYRGPGEALDDSRETIYAGRGE